MKVQVDHTSDVGRIIDTVSFTVEQGKVHEFARATFAESDVHVDEQAALAAGHAGIAATATHSVVSGHYRDQRAFVDALGLALERVVVGSVDWSYMRTLVVGDRLTGTRRVVADAVKEGKRGGSMRILTLETEFVDAAGSTVLRQREQIIERGAAS
ncbi:FAS1-like dehydratase domain-containing protein [Rhodococcoides kyotonense]|uniref:N-terminal half of MaoC dehydratase n=1 Tax=Rhodococcoides kyotonense TaxID=398843 RepID=A0A239K346_9NOCA|nr:MaoC family dehydratase N-terminal domain-containing protein [Rhodococcus kyotonensis]SNT12149.1 N-terminal half of MaoC dehydratase [Rhodococcus kyotonensis]